MGGNLTFEGRFCDKVLENGSKPVKIKEERQSEGSDT